MRQGVIAELYDKRGQPCTPQHYEIEMLEQRYPDYKKHSPFAILRDPWARTCSEYQWTNRNAQWGELDHWLDSKLSIYIKNQNHYVLDNHLRPQHEFVSDLVNIFVIDRYEHAQQFIEQQLGSNFDWSRREKVKDYEVPDISILSDRVKNMWCALYKPDIELYNHHLKSHR